MMGQVAAEQADHVIVTSDNPRSEDPDAIIAEIISGVPRRSGGVLTLSDRAAAIARSLAEAGPGDVIVLAGKGHETTQTVGDQVIPFDDRVVARELLAAMEAAR